MQLAMEAFSQVKKGHTVHVEIVAAARAPGAGRHRGKESKKHDPGEENRPDYPVRIRKGDGGIHRRQIDKDYSP